MFSKKLKLAHRITALGDTHWLRNFPSGKFSPSFPQYKPPHWGAIAHISSGFYGCTQKSAIYMPRTLISLVRIETPCRYVNTKLFSAGKV